MSLLRIPILLLIGSLLVSLEARADKAVDTLISNGRILTMNSGMVEYDRGFVAIKGNKIVAVGMQQDADDYSAKEVVDVDGDLIIPGLVNGHTHVSMTLLRSLGDDVPNRLHDYIFPLEKEFVTPAMVALGAELGNLELIKGGVTTFADMYYFEDEVAKVVNDSGLRAILGQTVIKYPRADAPTPQDAINATLKLAQKYQDHERITAAFAPHGPYTNSTETLQRIARLSLAHDIPVLMHLAESKVEQQTIAKRAGGLSPIAYMNDIGALNHNLIGAHVIIADHQDRELLKKHDVGVIHNISANIKSARSVAPVIEMLEQGIDVGLGTDGPMSGNTISLIDEFHQVAKLHKLNKQNRNVMPAIDVVKMATIGSAKAMNLDKKIGSIEVGKLADIIVIDTKTPIMTPIYNPYSALVYSAYATNVKHTMVHGKWLMKDRKVLSMNEPDVLRRATEFSHTVKKSLLKQGKSIK